MRASSRHGHELGEGRSSQGPKYGLKQRSAEQARKRNKTEKRKKKMTGLHARRRFAERHRRLVNVLIQQNVQLLLEGPLTQLMRTPRLIDFDNKRAFFRSQVRSASDRYHGSLRIHVRREHIFEDSFHQLRSKCVPHPSFFAAMQILPFYQIVLYTLYISQLQFSRGCAWVVHAHVQQSPSVSKNKQTMLNDCIWALLGCLQLAKSCMHDLTRGGVCV